MESHSRFARIFALGKGIKPSISRRLPQSGETVSLLCCSGRGVSSEFDHKREKKKGSKKGPSLYLKLKGS